MSEFKAIGTEPAEPDETLDAEGNNDLILEVKAGNDAGVELLISSRNLNHQNIRGVTALALAAQKGKLDCLTILLTAGAEVDLSNHNGSTPLIQASHFGHSEIVNRLLDKNACVDIRNNKGTTALMRAAQEGHRDVVLRLLHQRCDVNVRNEDGMNALMLGSQRGHADIVDILIRRNAIIDCRTVQGSTALMLSCKRGHTEVVQTLLSFGAELSVKDSKGRSAYDQASRRGQQKILELLRVDAQMMLMRKESQGRRNYMLKNMIVLFEKGRAHVNSAHLVNSKSLEALAWMFGCGMNERLGQHPLPYAICLKICEYMPLPRLWASEVVRLENRCCGDAYNDVVRGSLTIINEIFEDLKSSLKLDITTNQVGLVDREMGWLMHIASNPSIQAILKNTDCPMPPDTLRGILEEHDLESVLLRHAGGISCDVRVARKVLNLCKDVLMWYQWQDAPSLYPEPKRYDCEEGDSNQMKTDMDSAAEDSEDSDM